MTPSAFLSSGKQNTPEDTIGKNVELIELNQEHFKIFKNILWLFTKIKFDEIFHKNVFIKMYYYTTFCRKVKNRKIILI